MDLQTYYKNQRAKVKKEVRYAQEPIPTTNTLGLVIGTDVEAWDADLDAIAALDKTDGNIIVGNGSTWVAESGATARTSLGLGTADSPAFVTTKLSGLTDTYIPKHTSDATGLENSIIQQTSTSNVTIGTGTASTDYSLTFNGETNDGLVTWMEDEDYFTFSDDIHFGDSTNYATFSDTDGNITFGGTFKKKLALRPSISAGAVGRSGSPTVGVLGAWPYYTMPIWDSGSNVNKELYWRLNVPGRWDGTTDISYTLFAALGSAEDLNDDFAMQLVWTNADDDTGAISATVVTPASVDTNITAGHTAQYSVFSLTWTIDVSEGPGGAVKAGDTLAGRIRRVATAGTEIAGDILVIDHVLNFTIDKIYKTA